MNRIFALIRRADIFLILVSFFIVVFGWVALYSIGLGQGNGDFTLLQKQLVFSLIGLVLAIVCAATDFRFWRSAARQGYVLAVLLLIAVLIFGRTIRGVTGWFVIAGYQFQPVELVKFLLIVVLAWYFASAPRPLNSTRNVIGSLALVSVLSGLAMLQPDLGSAMLFFLVWAAYMFLIGLRPRQWLAIAGLGIAAFAFGWAFLFHDYQKERILSLLHPQEDVLGAGYAVNQSVIAIGSGGWIGSGLGAGSQSQLRFLPESHTDFIFSVIAEELGFVGAGILLILFCAMLLRMVALARSVNDDFAMLLVLGVVIMLGMQVVLNVGVTLGVLPVTGVTFPLVSYGGSSFLVCAMMLGVVQGVAVRGRG